MTNFEKYKEGLKMEDVIEDIRRYKCAVEKGGCPVEDLCNERTDCVKLIMAYFSKEAM